MSDTPTPETERIKSALHTNWNDLMNHARKLESERDEANEELSKKYIEFDKLFHEAEQIRIERDEGYQKITDLENELRGVGLLRDEAIRQLENIKASSIHTCHDQCQRPMCVLRRERDEAREENAKLRDIAEMAIEKIEQENWGIRENSESWKQIRSELDQIKEGAK